MTPLVVVVALVAGGLAALARYAVARPVRRRTRFPWAVLIVNVVGLADRGCRDRRSRMHSEPANFA